MYLGHYGIGLALKKFAKNLSLGWLFFAVQFVDILWAVLVLLGIERVNVVPRLTAASSLEFVYFPFSHSLVAFLVWAVAFYIIFRVAPIKQGVNRSRVALVMALGVLSHFVLDVIVHTPDMPILSNDSYKLGLGLWNYPAILTYAIEGVILVGGLIVYLKATKGTTLVGKYGMIGLVVVLFGLNAMFTFVEPPSDPRSPAILALIFYLIITGVAFWLDRKRRE